MCTSYTMYTIAIVDTLSTSVPSTLSSFEFKIKFITVQIQFSIMINPQGRFLTTTD